ncbi:MAG: hypothetical protein V3575_06955 [Candidatus Absconditabacteria bacterium]
MINNLLIKLASINISDVELITGSSYSSEINELTNGDLDIGTSNFTANGFLLGAFISIIGFAYFRYGKLQNTFVPMICGVVMMIFPYFVYDLKSILIITSVLIIIPFIIKF